MKSDITVQWMDSETKEIIFEDIMTRKKFKFLHGVSAHIGASGVIINDSRVRAPVS